MEDIWYTFPASMGNDQAWISYNHGYAEVANTDPQSILFRVRVTIKNPTEYGMPTNEEFPALSALDEELDRRITNFKGIYVGRVTVAGQRYFYFYVSISETEANDIINTISYSSKYDLQYIYEPDPEKKYYWNELFPTEDDWQVIQDLKVLDTLSEEGDIKENSREVTHWAYFDQETKARQYANWASEQNYKVLYCGKSEDNPDFLVQFVHTGTMNFNDITHHTIGLNRKARELDGRYDGWETSVERNKV